MEEKWWKRFSCFVERVHTIRLCISRFFHQTCSTERKKIGIKSHRQILQGYVGTSNFGKEQVHREEHFKVANLTSGALAHPSSRREHKMKPCIKNIKPAEWRWDLAKSVHKLKNKDNATFHSPIQAKEIKGRQLPLQTLP